MMAPSQRELKQFEKLYRDYLWAEKILEAWENDPVYPSDKHDEAVGKRDDAEKALADFTQEIEARYPNYEFTFEGGVSSFSAPISVTATARVIDEGQE
jgi:hypothetical protein